MNSRINESQKFDYFLGISQIFFSRLFIVTGSDK